MNHHIATRHIMIIPPCNSTPSRHKALGFAALIFTVLPAVLSGCSSVGTMGSAIGKVNPVNWITPYRVDVIQGNFISKEQVDALKPGMAKAQVRDLLGTPLLSSVFHADRWDYVFTLRRQGIASQAFKYTVFFKGDQLERFAGDTMPSEAEFIASLVNTRELGKVPVLEATEGQLKASEKPATSAVASSNGIPASSNEPAQQIAYPPLESPRQ